MPGPFDSLFAALPGGVEPCPVPATQQAALDAIAPAVPDPDEESEDSDEDDAQPSIAPARPLKRKLGDDDEDEGEDDNPSKRRRFDDEIDVEEDPPTFHLSPDDDEAEGEVDPAPVFHPQPPPSLAERFEVMDTILNAPAIDGSGTQSLPVAPTLLNTHAPQPRYFRLLVWNLENFTRDPRPRGSAAIASARNQARIAIAANLFNTLGADVLLCMETGRDVGTAMTPLADRIKAGMAADDPRTCEPLVSAPTHPAPPVRLDYDGFELGYRSTDRVLALRTLTSAFAVTPAGWPDRVTLEQLREACTLLKGSSPYMAGIDLPFEQDEWVRLATLDLGGGNLMPSQGWLLRCQSALANTWLPFTTPFILNDLSEWCRRRTLDASLEPPLDAFYDLIVHFRSLLRRAVREGAREACAALELTELTLLVMLKALGGMAEPTLSHLWRADRLHGGLLPLAVFYYALCERVTLRAHDRVLGPLGAAHDPELIVGALRRIGAVKYSLETYGIVYRPWTPEFKAAFLAADCGEARLDGRGIYGIMRQDVLGDTVRLQDPDDMLSGRSALFIRFPVGLARWLPVALHHNRFTGNEAIANMPAAVSAGIKLTKEEKVLRARTLSLVEVTRVGAMLPLPPLVVGDFNIPDTLLRDAERPTSKNSLDKWRRYQWLRKELREGVASHGYVRRVPGDDEYPATSLKSYLSMADEDNVRSQPYDAVYQPFDFMDGSVRVNSGTVVGMDLLIPQTLWEAAIDAPAPVPGDKATDVDIGDVDAGETDDAVATTGDAGNDAGDDRSATGSTGTTVGLVMAFEIYKIYRSIMMYSVASLKEQTWRVKTILDRYDKEKKNGDHFLFIISDVDALEKQARDRARLFHDALVGHPNDALAMGSTPFDGWITKLEAAKDKEGKFPRPSKGNIATLNRLIDIMTKANGRIAAIEANPTRRFWMAYRAVVSDHLPLIVEVDLQPDA